MKRLLTIAAVAAVFAACKEPRSWCPTEVSVPIVSADIPDTVDARQEFTVDFVLYKTEYVKEYAVWPSLKKDTVYFSGMAIQDYCDVFPDTANVEKSATMTLGDYDRYIAIYNAIDTTSKTIGSVYKYIVMRKK